MIHPISVPKLNLVNPEAKAPSFYQVVITKDEHTSSEFLQLMLGEIFFVSTEQSDNELSNFNNSGRLICGVYTYDVAESKLSQMLEYISSARQRLQCSLESL